MPQEGLQPITFTRFLRTQLRLERLAMNEGDVAFAENVDFHAQVGTAKRRDGTTKLYSSALADLTVHKLGKVASRRYQIAGTNAYRAQTLITDDRNQPLSSAHHTAIIPFRPLAEATEWAFIANQGAMMKDDGTTTRRWGITEPTIKAYGRFGDTLGDTLFAHTWVRFTTDGAVGHEGNPAFCGMYDQSGSLSTDVGYIEWIRTPSDPQVNGFGFWRTVAGGSVYLLETRLRELTANSRYSVMYGWEATLLSPSGDELFLQYSYPCAQPNTSTVDDDYYSPSLFVGTQIWEPGVNVTLTAVTGNGVTLPLAKYDQQLFGTPSENSSGYTCMYPWEFLQVGGATVWPRFFVFASSRADASLGEEVELDNDVPVPAHFAEEFDGNVFTLNTTEGAHQLYYSKRYRPEAIPLLNEIDVGSPTDPGKGLAKSSGVLVVFTQRTKYRVAGSEAEGFTLVEGLSRRGTDAPESIVASERGIIFLAHDGVFLATAVAPDEELSAAIYPLFVGENVNGHQPINFAAVETACGAYYRGRYYLAYPSGSSTVPDEVAVYSFETRGWTFYDMSLSAFFFEEDTNLFLGGGQDGYIYQLEGGANDDALTDPNIYMTLETADRSVLPLTRTLFLYLKVDADVYLRSLECKVYVDNVLKHTATVTGTRTKTLLRLPQGTWGYQVRLRFAHIGPGDCLIYSAVVYGLPLSAS